MHERPGAASIYLLVTRSAYRNAVLTSMWWRLIIMIVQMINSNLNVTPLPVGAKVSRKLSPCLLKSFMVSLALAVTSHHQQKTRTHTTHCQTKLNFFSASALSLNAVANFFSRWQKLKKSWVWFGCVWCVYVSSVGCSFLLFCYICHVQHNSIFQFQVFFFLSVKREEKPSHSLNCKF